LHIARDEKQGISRVWAVLGGSHWFESNAAQ
jgi:hypothetical protein